MKINGKNGVSLIVLAITILVIIILATIVISNLLDNNIMVQALKATYLSDVRNFQTELDLYKSNQLLNKMETYNPLLLQADENSVTYAGNVDNNITINNLIPSLNKSEEYVGQFVIVNGQLIYKGVDKYKQEWAKEIDVNNAVINISLSNNNVVAQMKDGTVMAWGQNNYGQLGDGTIIDKYVPTLVSGLTNVKQIAFSSSNYFTAALLDNGTVMMWGRNNYGQLGIGTSVDRNVPTLIPGLANVKQVEASNYHTVALLNDGTVMTWGRNNYGQLGDGTTVNKNVPTLVPGLTNVKKVFVGTYCTVVLLNDGTVMTWGYNYYGQLGDGTIINKYIPTLVPELANVKQISISNTYNMAAVLNDGTVMTWGYNNYGQLGDGTTINKSVPIVVTGLTNVAEIITNNSLTIAILNDGTAKAWGYNSYYQLGNGSSTNKYVPTVVTNLTNIKKIYIGSNYVVAHLNNDMAKVWGNNTYGQLGDGTTVSKSVPTIVSELKDIKQILVSNNYYTTVALLSDGTLMTCGANGWGQLGNGTTGNKTVPTEVSNLTGVADISVSSNYATVAILNNGTAKAWGYNTSGQLGDGAIVSKYVPTEVSGLTDVKQIVTANNYTAAVLNDGIVKMWGYNVYGQLGDGTTTNRGVPTAVSGLNNMKQLVCGNNYSVAALLNDGTIMTWGYNAYGQLGDGTTANKYVPTAVPNLTNVEKMFVGTNFMAALLNDGTVKTWGYNTTYGQLGDGTTVNRNIPTVVLNLTNVAEIVYGNSYNIAALLNDGTVMAWGRNTYGQVGDGTTTTRTAPVVVSGLTNVKQLVLGYYHAAALLNDGTVKTWGYNAYGQLGDGTGTNRYVPIEVSGLTNVKQIAAYNNYTVALLEDGTVKAWGENAYGQLGDGTVVNKTVPTLVPELTNVKKIIASNNYTVALLNDGTVKTWGYNNYGQLGVECIPSSATFNKVDIF
jgi:alpha-tubulin suppressor-like RCC1 family protein